MEALGGDLTLGSGQVSCVQTGEVGPCRELGGYTSRYDFPGRHKGPGCHPEGDA